MNQDANLSFTLEQGSIISSLAAIRATQPSVTLLRYTIGVFPISCIWEKKKDDHNILAEKTFEIRTK